MSSRALELALHIDRLGDDERAIVETIVERLEAGRHVYGLWNVADGRNNSREALAEVLDALNYCAAELVRIDKSEASR